MNMDIIPSRYSSSKDPKSLIANYFRSNVSQSVDISKSKKGKVTLNSSASSLRVGRLLDKANRVINKCQSIDLRRYFCKLIE